MVFTELSLISYSDGLLTIGLQPPTAIGGWAIDCKVTKRFGGESGLIQKSCASGYGNGASGITVTNSGQGIFAVRVNEGNTSGLDPGTYAILAKRTNSGFVTPLTQGWLILLPN